MQQNEPDLIWFDEQLCSSDPFERLVYDHLIYQIILSAPFFF